MQRKIECQGCKRLCRARQIIVCKGKQLCYQCRKKLPNIIQTGPKPLTLEEALKRTYLIRDNGDGKHPQGFRTFPLALIGKKVRLVLINEEEVLDE